MDEISAVRPVEPKKEDGLVMIGANWYSGPVKEVGPLVCLAMSNEFDGPVA